MTNEELDVFETVLREGWAIDSPITKIDMEFLASAADAITTLRAQLAEAKLQIELRDDQILALENRSKDFIARAERAEAALAAQIEADAGICGKHSYSNNQYVSMRMIDAAREIRAQPHDRTALDRMLRAEREKALRDAAGITRPDVSRRYCTNDEAFFNEGFVAAVNTILALVKQESN